MQRTSGSIGLGVLGTSAACSGRGGSAVRRKRRSRGNSAFPERWGSSTAKRSFWMVDMSSYPYPTKAKQSFFKALTIQCRVIGALIMRELHTRYGRDNIGYLWLIGEPLMLGSVIAVLHSGGGGAGHGGVVSPAVFAMVGYTVFILFRSIVNRSEGAIDSNAPLLYHRMVAVLDFTIARATLELAGTVIAFVILFGFCLLTGLADPPPHPLILLAGIGYVFWISFAVSMIITGGTYHRKLLERFVHPFTYFQIPFSAAFFEVKSVPHPYRDYLLYSPLPQAFEIVRYGAFEGVTWDFVDLRYLNGVCLVLTFLGLVAMKSVKRRVHLL